MHGSLLGSKHPQEPSCKEPEGQVSNRGEGAEAFAAALSEAYGEIDLSQNLIMPLAPRTSEESQLLMQEYNKATVPLASRCWLSFPELRLSLCLSGCCTALGLAPSSEYAVSCGATLKGAVHPTAWEAYIGRDS